MKVKQKLTIHIPVFSLPSNLGRVFLCYTLYMGQDYKKLLNKKKKKYCDINTMGVNIDKNEFYEIIMSNSAHPENIKSEK